MPVADATRIEEILNRAGEMLGLAQIGAWDVRGTDTRRQFPGFVNVAVYGRSVTNILENLRSVVPSFDDWYSPKVQEMKDDPLLRFFYKFRTDALKRVAPWPTSQSLYIRYLDDAGIKRLGPPPPGATGFFVGDTFGRVGWMVKLPDGREVPYPVRLPPDIGEYKLVIRGPPPSHRGRPITRGDAADICDHYVEYLSRLVAEARERFGS